MRVWLISTALALAGCAETTPGLVPPYDGDCSQAPAVLAEMPARSAGFLLESVGDRTFAFVSMNGVFRVPVAGGPSEDLVITAPTVQTSPLVRIGPRLHFAEHDFRAAGALVRHVPLTSGDVQALTREIVPGLPGGFSAAGIAGSGEHLLLLLAGRGHHLSWISRADGSVTNTMAQDTFGFRELRGDAGGVFLAALSAVHRLEGTVIAASAQALRPDSLALDSSHVYWREASDVGQLAQLRRAPRAMLAPVEVLGEVSDDDAFALTADRTHIYWSDASGAVQRMLKAGGPVERIATGGRFDDDDYDGAIAVLGDSVYWYAGRPGGFANDDAPLALLRACKP
jgi:hypothetical protein